MSSGPHDDKEEQPPAKESFFSVFGSLGFLVLLVFAFKSSVLDANNIPSGSMIPTLKIGDYLFVNKMRYSLRLPFTNLELFRYDEPKRGDIVTFIPPDIPGKHYVKRVMAMPGDRIRLRNVPACQLAQAAGKPAAKAADHPDFACGTVHEPQVAFVEYKPKDQGPWLNYGPTMLGGSIARQTLMDADNARVLPPDLHPPQSTDTRIPVILEEVVGGRKHMVVETSVPDYMDYRFACDDIKTKGCLVPPDRYMVMGDNRDDSKDSRIIGFIHRHMIQGKALIIYFSINWQDGICQYYMERMDPEAVRRGQGFQLEDFPPKDQARLCSVSDQFQEQEGISQYFVRTFRYRVRRMSVRWSRILKLLN